MGSLLNFAAACTTRRESVNHRLVVRLYWETGKGVVIHVGHELGGLFDTTFLDLGCMSCSAPQ